jgi:hypothetical protein
MTGVGLLFQLFALLLGLSIAELLAGLPKANLALLLFMIALLLVGALGPAVIRRLRLTVFSDCPQ